MRKVKSVLFEINELQQEHKLIEEMIKKILLEEKVSTYMKETFNITSSDLSPICSRLENEMQRLENALQEYEVEL